MGAEQYRYFSCRLIYTNGCTISVTYLEVYKNNTVYPFAIMEVVFSGRLCSRVSLALIVCFLPLLLFGQLLPRRAFLGLDLHWESEKQRLVVDRVHPSGAAQKAGILPGDALLEVNHQPLHAYQQLVHIVQKQHRPGDRLLLAIERHGQVLYKKVRLGEYPHEQAPDLLLSYQQVSTPKGRLRCIIAYPTSTDRQLPAMLFIQGMNCSSVDTPFDTEQPSTQLLYDIARQGFVTIRLEKYGIGDSEGPPCESVDYETELQAFTLAARQLKQNPLIDSTRFFLLGHSVGGIIAVQLAQQVPVKGIIAYGTIGRRWTDFLLESRRRMFLRKGKPQDLIDDYLTKINRCNVEYFVMHRPKEEVLQANPDCERYLHLFDIRKDEYWFQLQEVNVPAYWRAYKGALLSLWGEYDMASLEEDHQWIVDIVNQQNSGQATFMRLPQCDHGFRWRSSLEDVVASYNPLVAHVIVQWIRALQQQP